MTTHADGTSTCDRCGADIGNAGLDKCARVSALSEDGADVLGLHLCTFKGRLPDANPRSPEAQRCVTRVLTKAALAHNVDHEGKAGVAPTFHEPKPETK